MIRREARTEVASTVAAAGEGAEDSGGVGSGDSDLYERYQVASDLRGSTKEVPSEILLYVS